MDVKPEISPACNGVADPHVPGPEEVGAVDGVTAVDVDLSTGAMIVTSDEPIDDAAVRAAVVEAGYLTT